MEPGRWEREWEEATPRTGWRDAERTLGAPTLPECSSQAWRLVDLLGAGGAAGASPEEAMSGGWGLARCGCVSAQ